MNHLFYLTFGLAIFSALALVITYLSMQTSHATMQRIHEVTHRGRDYRRNSPMARDAGRRLFTMLHRVRAWVGLADEANLPERLANAGLRGTFPADVYNAARILCPVMALALAIFIPMSRMFWIVALPAAAYITPNIVLTRLIKRRREKGARAFQMRSIF